MAEVVTAPLPVRGILYSEAQLASWSRRFSKLKPVEPGDLCCNCGGDCDQDGFATGEYRAMRINGHPICARSACHSAKLSEFAGYRSGCRCGANQKRNVATVSEQV